VNANLQDQSDAGAMCGPTVEVKSGSDGVSVQVGHVSGVTALTPAEWDELAAGRGEKPYVLVDTAPGRKPFVSPLRTYADAMDEFNRDVRGVTRPPGIYGPDTGRHLAVMSQADYLKACEKWSQS
jgi:hypothetical protein